MGCIQSGAVDIKDAVENKTQNIKTMPSDSPAIRSANDLKKQGNHKQENVDVQTDEVKKLQQEISDRITNKQLGIKIFENVEET